jgi:DNA-binding MarR family transcriptional regulator/GNAT superfamily N-acetyltransferase
VRSFNRVVAERIGALSDVFLGRGRPMAESRILWEIGQANGLEVRRLRQSLNLDSGYTSRVLQSLVNQGLITLEPGPSDARVRTAQLTAAGKRELYELDQRSDDVAKSFLVVLNEQQQLELVAAMQTVEHLLRASSITIQPEDPTTADAVWCIQQYFRELNTRFEAGFDPAQSISADASELTPPRGVLLIAKLRGRPVGCGALKLHACLEDEPAELKRMWVASEVRGLGLGRRLLTELETYARNSGATRIHLETNRSLREAIHLYRTSGYTEVPAFNSEPYAHHWFEKSL